MKRAVAILSVLVMVVVFSGCPRKPARQAQGVMDTPQHHVEMADRYIHKGDWDAAHKEYQLAIGLDSKYVPALAGEALYFAHAKNPEEAEKYRKLAWDYAKKPDQKLEYYIGMIRYHAFMGEKNWIKHSEDAFARAKEIKAGDERIYYYMGWAYKEALQFSDAEAMYKKVIELNGKLREDANNEWELVQKIVRAKPGTPAGLKIALVKEITKADVAALFVQEMHLPELWQKRGIKKWETPSFQTPGEARMAQQGPVMPSDIADHPLRSDIEAVLGLGIRGLEVMPDGKFYPNNKITRAEYALMLEDILIKVLNEPGLATRYVADPNSQFHDMRTDNFAYNAAVVVSNRQIMPADMEGNFKPLDPVAGVDALLVIRKMQDYLKISW